MKIHFCFVADTWNTNFSQYADDLFVEKEIVSLQKQSLNKASSSSNSNNQMTEVKEKLSGEKNSSDTNKVGQGDSLDSAARQGTKEREHVDNKVQAANKEKGDEEELDKDFAESEKPDKEKTEKNKKDSPRNKDGQQITAEGSAGNESEDSNVDAGQSTSGGPPGKQKPNQETERKSYAEATSNSQKRPSRGRATVMHLSLL